MSYPDSDTESSSSRSVLSRSASLQPQDELASDTIYHNKSESNHEPEGSPAIDDAASDTSSSIGSTPYSDSQFLHLEWNEEEEPQNDNADNQDSTLSDHEPRFIDFVVVPGVYAKWDEGIGTCPGSGSSAWVSEFAGKTSKSGPPIPRNPIASCRILRYNYNSSEIFCGRWSRQAIHQIALKLLRSLLSKRRKETKKRLIYFITHDIGGVIVKDALVTAALEGHAWMDISEMARVIVFNGCPHRSFNTMDLEDRLTRFLFENYDSIHGNVRPSVSSISGISEAVLQINGLFIESKLPLRSWVISLHSQKLENPGIHNAFDGFGGTMGFPLEKRIPDPSDLDYWPLTKYLRKLELEINEAIEPTQYRYERNLLALASPVYPPKTEKRSNPLADLPEYQAWLDSPSPQILYIHGNHSVQEVAEQVFYSLEGQVKKLKMRARVLYFSFDRWDVRCDSIRDMIATFVAQIANHHPKLTKQINFLFNQMHNERCWTEADLIQFFELFRISDKFKQTMIVINRFDECTKGSRKMFLDNIIYKNHNDEIPWKIVVTSHKLGSLSDELSGPFCVPVDLSRSDLGAYINDSIKNDIERLSKLRPDLIPQEPKVREELQSINKLELPMRQIIYEQVRARGEWPDETSIQEIFGSLDLTQNGVKDDKALEIGLDWVLKKFPDQAMLRRLLSWLLCAVRPPTIWELATVLSVGTDQDQGNISPSLSVLESLISKIQMGLAGIIEVDHNAIKFQHPQLHSIMLASGDSKRASAEKQFMWDGIKDTAQSDITSLCLEYLSKATVQEYIEKTFKVTNSETLETPTFPDRTNLASYAIQAWMHHYSLSSHGPDLSVVTSQAGLVQTLARAHWILANPITRSSTCSEALFPIFAGLGLHNAIRPLDEIDAFNGLLEAARKGQSKVVQDLVEEYTFNESQLLEALEASGSSGNEDMMLSLLDYLSKAKNLTDIQWPPVLIYRAAWLNLDRFAERILTLGCSPDPEVEWKVTMQASPLFQATRNGHVKTVRVLLKHGASMKHTGMYDRNPFHVAAARGHAEVIRIIIEEEKVAIDCTSENNLTALSLAVGFGHHKAAEQLLDMGADSNMGISPESRDDDQWSPLIVVSCSGFKRCAKLLLDKGANPNIYGPVGPPLQWAVGRGHLEILDMLLAAGADPKSELIKSPLLAEAVGWNFKYAGLPMLERLLELNLDVNAKDIYGTSALVYAAQSYPNKTIKNTVIYQSNPKKDLAVRKLLGYGADPNLGDSTGLTPLHHATLSEQYNLAEILLEAGADPNKKSKSGTTPLFYALHIPEITRLLLEKGANPDLGITSGWTNLTRAAFFGHIDTVKLLLRHGASVDLEYGDGVEEVEDPGLRGWTPLMCAAAREFPDIVRMLAEAGANMKHKAVKFNQPVVHQAAFGAALPAFLEFPTRVDVNQVDSDGWAATHFSAISFDNLKRLVNAGANIEAKNEQGDTPLTIAAGLDLERTRYLVNNGADINHVSPWHGAALHEACRAVEFGIIKFLIENGADINQVCDGFPGTPLQALCIRRPGDFEPSLIEEMVRYLLDEDEEHPHMRSKDRRADATVKAGILGFAINAAALSETPNIINLILEQERATIDVRDDVDRMPVHYAALNGIRNFEAIIDRGGDIYAKDKLGRTALHWAAQAGRLQVVERIISLLDDKTAVDTPDIDGWTPLCWAARGPLSCLDEKRASEPSAQTNVIRLLLENGANQTVVASVGDENWTPLKIAHYHRCPSQVLSMLIYGTGSDPSNREDASEELLRANGAQETKGKEESKSKRGILKPGWTCDGCHCVIVGFVYPCKTCPWLCFCFKCYPHIALIHSPEHEFEKVGGEEYEECKQEDLASVSSGTSDSDSDSDSDNS